MCVAQSQGTVWFRNKIGTEVDAPQNTWMYDHVWAQTDVCLDSNAMVAQCPAFQQTGPLYQHFMADDYTWITADGSYFYYAWCDRSDTFIGTGGNSRPDPNIRLAKVKQ